MFLIKIHYVTFEQQKSNQSYEKIVLKSQVVVTEKAERTLPDEPTSDQFTVSTGRSFCNQYIGTGGRKNI